MAKTTKTVRPVRSAKDLRFQIESGINLRDWEPEDLALIFEDSIRLQEMLGRARVAMEEDGRMRGESPLLDEIYALLGE